MKSGLINNYRQQSKDFAIAGDINKSIISMECVVSLSKLTKDRVSLVKLLTRQQCNLLLSRKIAVCILDEINQNGVASASDFLEKISIFTSLKTLTYGMVEFCNLSINQQMSQRHCDELRERTDRYSTQLLRMLIDVEASAASRGGAMQPILDLKRLDEMQEHQFHLQELSLQDTLTQMFLSHVGHKSITRNVAIITNSLAMGGNEKNAITTANALAKHHYVDKVVLIYGDKVIRHRFFASDDFSDVKEVDIYSFDSVPPWSSDYHIDQRFLNIIGLNEIERIQYILKKEKIDIVHSFASDNRNCQVALACMKTGVRFVGLNPGSLSPKSRPGTTETEKNWVTRLLFRSATDTSVFKLFFCSMAACTDYSEWLDVELDDCHVNYVGIEYSQTLKPIFADKENSVIIGGAFRLHEAKDPYLWIKIAKHVCETNNDCSFEIAGDGPLLEDVKNKAKELGIESRVKFHGAVNDIAKFYSTIDIFLLTSKSEGLGNVMLEAQSFGVPAVARAVGGIPETVIQFRSGYLLDSENPKKYAKILLELIENASQREQMGRYAKKFVQQRFPPSKMVGNLVEYWKVTDTNLGDIKS